MHALRAFIQEQMDARGWAPTDLARASSLSKQTVSNLLAQQDGPMTRMLRPETITGLARAFAVNELVILAKIGEAMGLPVSEPVVVYDASRVPNEDLIRVLTERLRAKEVVGNAEHPAPMTTQQDPADIPAGGESSADLAWPRPPVVTLHRRGWNGGEATRETDPDAWLETPNDATPPPPPIDEAAARRTGGPSRGAQLRARQDASGEAPDEPPSSDT
ncbi:helix-turn-helix transcriptional regulator [Georgenia sp. MJ206]|uniref:helix-turn-helix domain-containing protein n=1 Tax=Georgenia wangjunii TaxID=3117730 RepID=UPI002F26D8DB